MIEAVCELLGDWRNKHKAVRTIRCDNAKENNALEKRAKSSTWQLGLTFQYTSSNSPQMNSLVEKFFDTIYNRARATMLFSNIPDDVKHIVCKYLFLHLTHLFNLKHVTKGATIATKYEWFGLALPKFTNLLRPWGEAGIVHVTKVASRKLDDRGIRMMYVGASLVHSHDSFLMYNPSTKRTHISRDVVFTKKMFYREDFSVSSDKEHPLDISFENLRIIVNESSSKSSSNIEQPPADLLPPRPITPPLVEEASEDEDDMPSLSIRPDTEDISTIEDTAPTIEDHSTIDTFNNDTVYVLPDPPTSPNAFEELSLTPDDRVPDFIDISSPPPSDDEMESTH